MPRKVFHRSLPPLAKVHPGFRGFRESDNKTALVLERLHATIEKTRRDEATPFYSIREVADFFGVALKTVVEAYEKLEAKGLLTRVRGSHTVMEGRRRQPRHPVRGVVGVPVYLPPLVIGTDWRAFLMKLEEELRHYHFVCDFVFYRATDQESDALTERLLEHQLDIVLWYVPIAAHAPTMRHLLDSGIKLVVISDGKGRFPREQFFLDLDSAITDAIRAWRRAGINSFVILQSPQHPSAHAHQTVLRALAKESITPAVLTLTDDEVPGVIQRLTRHGRQGVILHSHPWYEILCAKFPAEMERLFHASQVFLAQGPVFCPAFEDRPVFADSISLPNADIARRVAHEISTGRVWKKSRLATFHTRYEPRVNLGQVTREI